MAINKIFLVCFSLIYIMLANCQQFERQLESYTKCSADSNCTIISENSICVGNTIDTVGLCTCLKGFVIDRNRTSFICLKEAVELNDPCQQDIQCQVSFENYASCTAGKCVCQPGSHFYRTKCWETVKLTQTCKFQENCLLKNGSLADCVEGKCSCLGWQHPVSEPDGERCEKKVKLGDACTNSGQCYMEDTRCDGGVCRCKPGYTTNPDETMCFKYATKLYEECTIDDQCERVHEKAVCATRACRCQDSFHEYENKCYKNVKLNGTCDATPECLIPPNHDGLAECKNGVCTCTGQYSEDGTMCVNGAETAMVSATALVVAFSCYMRMFLFE